MRPAVRSGAVKRPPPELPLDAAGRVEVACGHFEQAWRSGRRPRVEDHLAGTTSTDERRVLLRELIVLDVNYRARADEHPSAGEYLGRFPAEREAVLAALGEAAPAGAGLVARAAGLLARFGAPVRFAARAVLGAVVPGIPAAVELVVGLFDAADPATAGPDPTPAAAADDRRRAADLLDALAGEFAELVARVAALEGEADAASRVIEAALTSDPGCRAGVERLAKSGLAADARTLGLVAPAGPSVVLEVTAGPHRGLRFEYDRHDTLLVGRGVAANLQLIDDAHFSRHHFLLEFNPPRVYLRDLASSNGTKVNGKPVTECHLADGDEIGGGTTRIRVTLPKPAVAETVTHAPRAATAGVALSLATIDAPRTPPGADLPTFIPGYEFVRKLGAGGMGAVYLARQNGTGREVAVKLMLPESAASERAMQLFLREVSVLSKLDHPNVVRYLDVGSALGQFYFVMEYIPCGPLADAAASLTPARRVPFVCGVLCRALDGLAYAHARGFVHRDFKPANLLVGAGDRPVVKVSDFGLAKSFQNAGFSGMTLSGQAMGTLAYMAPEQLTHCRDAKPAADVYAVGATIYALLAGRPPLDVRPGRDPVRVLLEDPPPLLAAACPWVPQALATVVHRALRKAPADRFPDAAAMRAAVAPFAAPDPT